MGAMGLMVAPASAAGPKRTFRCTVRLDRDRDKKTIRQIDAVVEDGKTVSVLDGTWNYDQIPRSPRGLYATLTVSDGAKVHLKIDAEFGQAGGEAAGGNRVIVTDSKTSVDDDFVLGQPVAYPWVIAGESHTLVVAVDVAPPATK